MPSGLASRDGNTTVTRLSKNEETFQVGLRSFINEARLLAQFDHPSLVKVHQFWEANGTAYMVMPFYEGQTLKETLNQDKAQINEAWLKDLLKYLLDALEVIHQKDCFHRDIAPDNILILEKDGRPLLLDFGAARRVISNLTQNITVILKPGYAPIEQYAEVEKMKQGAWTDIYALAAVVYFAVAGKVPVQAVSRIISDTLAPLSKIKPLHSQYSSGFLLAIDKALAVKPEDRPQDTKQFRKLLGLKEANDSPKLVKSGTGSSLVKYGFGVIVLIVSAFGGWYFLQQHPLQTSDLDVLEKNIVATPEPVKDPALSRHIKVQETSGNREEETVQDNLVQVPDMPEKKLEPESEQVTETKVTPPVSHVIENKIVEEAKKPETDRVSKLPSYTPEPLLPEITETKKDYFFGSDIPLRRENQETRPPKTVNMPSPTASDRIGQKYFLSQSLLEETIMDHLLDGKVCLNKKDYVCAIAKAEAVLQLEPSNINAKKLINGASAGQDKAREKTDP